MNTHTLVGGQVIVNVHSSDRCRDEVCCIHNPSSHGMRHLPQHWDDAGRIMWRECSHEIFHPDPDDRNHYELLVHECDCECCLMTPERAASEIAKAMSR